MMDDVKHTSGPWLMAKTDSAAIVYTLRETKWNGLPMLENAWQAQFEQDGGHKTPLEEVFANARVAVAGPDMLAFIQSLVSAMDAPLKLRKSLIDARLLNARALIAKATGGV